MPSSPALADLVEGATGWERVAAAGSVVLLAAIAWLAGRGLLGLFRVARRLGIRGLDRLAAPLALLVAVELTGALLAGRLELPVVALALDLLGVAGGFWLAARGLDVAWATAGRSARLRAQPAAVAGLLAGRRLGKVALGLLAAAVIAVRLGATRQLYLALGAIGAALAFAARGPIQNAFAFVELLVDPPFHLGDRVRLVDFRGGEDCEGEVVRIALTSITIRTRARTLVTVSTAAALGLRIENLSAASRRRVELDVPVEPAASAEALRAACEAIEADLRTSPYVSERRRPRVWIAGHGEGLRLRASAWLRKAVDRREAEREFLLGIRARLQEA